MVYHILWDNGWDACGEFPWDFATKDRAQAYADSLLADNISDGVWDDTASVEVIRVAPSTVES
jgi:hypothetical protein